MIERRTAIVSCYGTGGSLLYWQQLAGALRRKDYRVIHYLAENTPFAAEENGSHRRTLKDPSTCPAFLKVRAIKYLYHLLKYLNNALALKPERDLKAVHLLFPFYLSDWITVGRLKRKGLRVILTVHEAFPHRAFLGGAPDRALLKKMFKQADLLFVHGDSIGNELMNSYSIDPLKIRVIPHGYFDMPEGSMDVPALKRKYRVPADKKILLFFGAIRENKGLDTLLQAVHELKPDFFLLIAGDSAGAAETPTRYYERIIENKRLGESVRWIKRYISNEEVPEVFRVADAVVLPYKKSFFAQSGVLHLSIGYERPCIVSDIGAIGATVADYDLGLAVKPEDPAALSQGILSLFERLKTDHTFNFKKCKEDNNWDKVADKVISAYNELS